MRSQSSFRAGNSRLAFCLQLSVSPAAVSPYGWGTATEKIRNLFMVARWTSLPVMTGAIQHFLGKVSKTTEAMLQDSHMLRGM